MGLWASYLKTLKPLSVEEPIDVWVHRPLAYLLTRALYPTPITPNQVTLISILFGLMAGTCFVWPFAWHMPLGGLCIFLSAIFDCADGQLARMRGTSSAFGRMLDGIADLVVTVAAVGGGLWVLWVKYGGGPWSWLWVVLGAGTAVTSSFHTALYDHYKNVYLRLTVPGSKEGEDQAAALERRERERGKGNLLQRAAWYPYLFYVKSQEDAARSFDPHTETRLADVPEYNEEHARIYAKYNADCMRLWRNWFGFGSLVFGLAVAGGLDLFEVYVALRITIQNVVFYFYLRPRQRAASEAAFREIGYTVSGRRSAGAESPAG